MFCLRTGWTPEQVRRLTVLDYQAIEKELVAQDKAQAAARGRK